MLRQSLSTSHEPTNTQLVPSDGHLGRNPVPFPIPLPQFHYWAWRYMVWNGFLASSRWLSQVCPLWTSRRAPILPAVMGRSGKKKALMLCKHYLATGKTSGCYQQWFSLEIHNTAPCGPLWRKLTPSQPAPQYGGRNWHSEGFLMQ